MCHMSIKFATRELALAVVERVSLVGSCTWTLSLICFFQSTHPSHIAFYLLSSAVLFLQTAFCMSIIAVEGLLHDLYIAGLDCRCAITSCFVAMIVVYFFSVMTMS